MISSTFFGRTAFLAAALALLLTTASQARAACDDPAGPGVDWSGCEGHLLLPPLSNLRGANLRGATFKNSDFSRLYMFSADLTGANLTNVSFGLAI